MDQLACLGAQTAGEYSVIRAGASASLHMAGYGDTYFSAGLLLDLCSHFVRYGRERIFFHLFLVVFFGQGSIFPGNRTLSHGDNGKTAALFVPVFDLLDHLIDIIRDLREQDDGTAVIFGNCCNCCKLRSPNCCNSAAKSGRSAVKS